MSSFSRHSIDRPSAGGTDTLFALAVASAFVVAASVSIRFHEPWRDELQAWLIARDATGPLSLLANLRYEGHPGLWHLFLLPATRLGGPWLMQALNMAFMGGAVFLFARFAPFGRAAGALFAFGYLPLYEWGTIARNYAVGVFFLFLFAALFPRRARHPLLLGAVLALAANTSVHAAIVAAGALALLALERLAPWREREGAAHPLTFWSGIGLGVAGLAASALQILPPADSAVGALWVSRTVGERLAKAVSSFVQGFAPVPWPDPLARTRFDWLNMPQIAAGVLLTAAFAITAGLSLARRRAAWILAGLSVLALVVLFYACWYGGPRHAGFLLVATAVALWVAPSLPERTLPSGRLARASEVAQKQLASVMAAMLAFNLVGAAIAIGVDATSIFSAAPATAALIRERGLAGLPMVADPDFVSANVVAQLGKPSAYYANVERWGSFAIWDGRHGRGGDYAHMASDDLVFQRAAALAHDTSVVVLLNREARAEAVTRAGASLVGSRRADIFHDESFWVYLVPTERGASAVAGRTR